MNTSKSELGRYLHTFFNEYLTKHRNVSAHTILAYRDALKLLLHFAATRFGKNVDALNLDELGVETVLMFLDHLEDERNNSLATRNARLAALHAFCRHIASCDPARFDFCQRILGIPFKRAPRPTTYYLEKEELEAILGSIDRSKPAGRRDYALLALAYQTGVRVAELVSIRACDLQLDQLPQVRIWGKGRKERLIPLWPTTATLIRDWIDERNIDSRGTDFVFVNMRGQPLTRWGVNYILKKYSRVAEAVIPTVASKPVHAHVLRHTTAVHMLDSGADTSAIRDLFGHATSETTWRYTKIRRVRKRKLIESCAPSNNENKSTVPLWRSDPGLLEQLENIGRRRDYVKPSES